MEKKYDERCPLRTIECERRKENNQRYTQNEETRGPDSIVKYEQNNHHANHPQELPPGKRAGDLVFDIDKLGDTEHHNVLYSVM